jgi:hypothetical protein
MRDWEKHFTDVGPEVRNNGGGGVFQGEGHQHIGAARTELTREGLKVEFACDLCGRPSPMLVSWPELVAIANQIAPMDPDVSMPWTYHQQGRGFQPPLACAGCRTRLGIVLFPKKCLEAVQQGVAHGYVDPRAIAATEQAIRQGRR